MGNTFRNDDRAVNRTREFVIGAVERALASTLQPVGVSKISIHQPWAGSHALA